MKKIAAVLAVVGTVFIPAVAYADILAPGTVVIGGSRVNLIPIIFIVAVIIIAAAIIRKAIRNKKNKKK